MGRNLAFDQPACHIRHADNIPVGVLMNVNLTLVGLSHHDDLVDILRPAHELKINVGAPRSAHTRLDDPLTIIIIPGLAIKITGKRDFLADSAAAAFTMLR